MLCVQGTANPSARAVTLHYLMWCSALRNRKAKGLTSGAAGAPRAAMAIGEVDRVTLESVLGVIALSVGLVMAGKSYSSVFCFIFACAE